LHHFIISLAGLQIGEASLCDFLHHNYPAFFGDVCDIAEASQYLSDSEIIASNFEGRDALQGKQLSQYVSTN